jgi:hypothetical protein
MQQSGPNSTSTSNRHSRIRTHFPGNAKVSVKQVVVLENTGLVNDA